MGYTHYYAYRPQDDSWQDIWHHLRADVLQICDASADLGAPLADGMGEGAPRVENEGIWLNGPGDAGHETLHLFGPVDDLSDYIETREDYAFGFCKTGRKPYDAAVGAILLRAAQLAPESFVIGSDGGWDAEWLYGAARDATQASPRMIARDLFGDDRMPPRAWEYFTTDIDAGELLRRGLRRAIPEVDPGDRPTKNLTDTLFDYGPGM